MRRQLDLLLLLLLLLLVLLLLLLLLVLLLLCAFSDRVGVALQWQRDEGEATVHASTLLHGVARMANDGGVRHSLIVFVGKAV